MVWLEDVFYRHRFWEAHDPCYQAHPEFFTCFLSRESFEHLVYSPEIWDSCKQHMIRWRSIYHKYIFIYNYIYYIIYIYIHMEHLTETDLAVLFGTLPYEFELNSFRAKSLILHLCCVVILYRCLLIYLVSYRYCRYHISNLFKHAFDFHRCFCFLLM